MQSLTFFAWIALLIAAATGLLLTPIAIRLARSLGLVDQPGVRKIHRTPVPRIGGLAIAIATLLAFAITAAAYSRSNSSVIPIGPMLTLIAAAVCVLILGLIDDIHNVRAKYKLVILLGVTTIFCASGGAIHHIVWNGDVLFDLGIFSWPVTILWMVGVTVSINFIDGVDGLAAGIVAIACGVLAMAAAVGGAWLTVLLAVSLMGGLLGFLFFNFNPASIFMGDCGSMFIGYLLAGSCAISSHAIGTTRSLILPALALSVPLLDTLLTFIRRSVVQRQSIFAAECGHIHHRLLDIGLQPRQAVLLLYIVTGAAAGVGGFCLAGNAFATILASVAYCLLLGLMFRMAGSVQTRQTLTAMRRNRALNRQTRRYQHVFADLQVSFREAITFDLWWQHICKAAEALDFAHVSLPIVRRDGTTTTMRWRQSETDLAESDSITAEIPIQQRRAGETMRISVEALTAEFLENSGHRIALFTRLMGEFSLANLPEKLIGRESHAPSAASAAADDLTGEQNINVAPFQKLRVAIVHDFLYTYAGAERVVEQLVALFPQADLFSLFDFLPDHLRGFIRNKPVKTSFIQRLPWVRNKHRNYLLLMPLAIEQLDVFNYDLVISSSYLVAKGVLTRPDQLHICYCHTPVRFAWDLQNQYLSTEKQGPLSLVKDTLARLVLHYIRSWDLRSAQSVDVFITNSDFVGRRVKKLYRRLATTVYPPVDTDRFTLLDQKEDFYLTASRLVPYKRIDLIVEAFAKMPDRRLVVIGEGPDLERIRGIATANVRILGYQTPDRLRLYMQRSRAFVFAAEEDFGITPVEAQACGTPVIAFGRGGVTESVIHGRTGILFKEQTVEAITEAINEFESRQWDAAVIRQNAERFSIRQFREHFMEITKKEWTRFLVDRIEQKHDEQFAAEAELPETEMAQ